METQRKRHNIWFRVISALLVCVFTLTSIPHIEEAHALAPWTTTQDATVRRDMVRMAIEKRFPFVSAESREDQRLLALNDADILIRPDAEKGLQYLLSREAAYDDLAFLRAFNRAEIKAVMEILAREDKTKYAAIEKLIRSQKKLLEAYSKLFPEQRGPDLSANLPIDDIIARAFELLLLEKERLITDNEMTPEEKRFLKAAEPVMTENKDTYFTNEFRFSRVREMKIRIALANGMRFDQTNHARQPVEDNIRDGSQAKPTPVPEPNLHLSLKGNLSSMSAGTGVSSQPEPSRDDQPAGEENYNFIFECPASSEEKADLRKLKSVLDKEFGDWSDDVANTKSKKLMNDMRAMFGKTKVNFEYEEDKLDRVTLIAALLDNENAFRDFKARFNEMLYHAGQKSTTVSIKQPALNITLDPEIINKDFIAKFEAIRLKRLRLARWDFLNRFPGAGGILLWKGGIPENVKEKCLEYSLNDTKGAKIYLKDIFFTYLPNYAAHFEDSAREEPIVVMYVPVSSIKRTSWIEEFTEPRIEIYEPEIVVNGPVEFRDLFYLDSPQDRVRFNELRNQYEAALFAIPNLLRHNQEEIGYLSHHRAPVSNIRDGSQAKPTPVPEPNSHLSLEGNLPPMPDGTDVSPQPEPSRDEKAVKILAKELAITVKGHLGQIKGLVAGVENSEDNQKAQIVSAIETASNEIVHLVQGKENEYKDDTYKMALLRSISRGHIPEYDICNAAAVISGRAQMILRAPELLGKNLTIIREAIAKIDRAIDLLNRLDRVALCHDKDGLECIDLPASAHTANSKTVNGIRTMIKFNMKERGIIFSAHAPGSIFRDKRKEAFLNAFEDNATCRRIILALSPASSTLDSALFSLCKNSYDSFVDKIKKHGLKPEGFTGELTIETLYDGDYLVVNVIDNGETIKLEKDGTPIRGKKVSEHFGGRGKATTDIRENLDKLGGTIKWYPLKDGTKAQIRILRKNVPHKFQLGEDEYIVEKENREERNAPQLADKKSDISAIQNTDYVNSLYQSVRSSSTHNIRDGSQAKPTPVPESNLHLSLKGNLSSMSAGTGVSSQPEPSRDDRDERNRGDRDEITPPSAGSSEEVAFAEFVDSVTAITEASKERLEPWAIKRVDDTIKQYEKTGQSLILYADDLLENAAVVDFEDTIKRMSSRLRGGKIIIFARNPVNAAILDGMTKRADSELKTVIVTPKELEDRNVIKESESSELKALVRIANTNGASNGESAILGVIRGPIASNLKEARQQYEIDEIAALSRNKKIPIIIVGLENINRAKDKLLYSYSFKWAIVSAIDGKKMPRIIFVSPVQPLTPELEKRYYESLKALQSA